MFKNKELLQSGKQNLQHIQVARISSSPQKYCHAAQKVV